ncbi:sulfatase-like hydrolase/transferase [Kribbella sp. NPDC051952]|uniref:sulfatase family protein n=1 Tax=Kribbella sp. NPDC051952 TaxID=3154851 RepID=UPI0034271654
MSRPNIWLILCDQLRADALGCYGNPIVETPAIDELAATGALYTSAYTPSPVCVPARASLISGREPHVNECYDNGSPMPDGPTLMSELTAAGYRTHGVGKMHFTPDGDALRGFQSRDSEEEFGTADSDDYLAWVEKEGYGHVEYPHGLRDEMYYVPQLSQLPAELHPTTWVADRSITFLHEQNEDEPFFLWSSFIAPHPPFTPPSPWHRRYPASLMPDPHLPVSGDGLLTAYNRLQNRYKYRDGGRDRRLEQLIRSYYYASVTYVDHQIGRVVTELKRRGQFENTVIVLTADHGEFLGDYGCFGKRSFLDAAARVPMICRGPGFGPAEIDGPVSLVDVLPTLLTAADTMIPATDGVPLQSARSDRVVFGQFQQGELGLYAVITERWKYIWSAPDGKEYLIDRRWDRGETSNRAYNVRLRDVLLELRAQAAGHFPDLAGTDFDVANRPLKVGAAPGDGGGDGLAALERDADAATIVVQWE